MSSSSIFLICTETKESFALSCLADPLRRRGFSVHLIDDLFGELALARSDKLISFATEQRPIVIVSHAYALQFMSFIRPRETFLSICLEHGIAPFKRYTWSKYLLSADCYVAPTKLWFDRLVSLFPEAKEKIWLGGFGRISELADLRKLQNMDGNPPARYQKWFAQSQRKLVIFSWDVNGTSLRSLPDSPDIVYLLHPANKGSVEEVAFHHAEMVISTSADCAFLLSNATKVFGDFSSLTLEAVALEIPVIFFLDRTLYNSDCDMGTEFFDPNSASYASIPETGISIARHCIASLNDLRLALNGADHPVSDLQVPIDILPPRGDNRELLSETIISIICGSSPMVEGSPDPANLHRLDCASIVSNGYNAILGRKPDDKGFAHYAYGLYTGGGSIVFRAMKLFVALSQSDEAHARISRLKLSTPKLNLAVGAPTGGDVSGLPFISSNNMENAAAIGAGVSRADVVAAYRLILGREPESEEVILKHLGHTSIESLRKVFLTSDEFKKELSKHLPILYISDSHRA